MDPISAVSIAAASLQFAAVAAKGILGAIGFLKSLKEAPVRLTELLYDIDISVARSIHLQQTLQDPESALVRRLSYSQHAALATIVNDACQTTISLQEMLEPLFRTHNAQPQNITKLWRSVVSVKMERGIEDKFEKIQRLNNQIMRELQLSGLDIQIQLSDTSEKALAAVEQSRSETESRFDSLETLTEGVHRELREGNSHAAQALNRSIAYAAQLDSIGSGIEEIGISSHEVHMKVDGLSERIISTQSKMASQLELTVKQESSVTKEELLELRNAVMPIIMGIQTKLSSLDRAAASRLSDLDKADLVTQLRRELMSHPGTLRDACDYLSPALALKASQQCRCHSHWKAKSVARGPFSFRVKTGGRHEPTCPHKGASALSWKYQLGIQLLPFLNKTVELTFGATFAGGGFQVESPLTVFATVKRSESRIFQLFEHFPDRCGARKRLVDRPAAWWRLQKSDRPQDCEMFFGYTWDVEVAKRQLQQIHGSLIETSENGIGCISDKDEYGHTVLHEIITLIGLLASVYANLVDDIDALLVLADRYGVDQDSVANSKAGSRRYSTLEMLGWSGYKPNDLKNWTVADAARNCVKMFHAELREFSFLSRLSSLRIDFERCIHQSGDDDDDPEFPLAEFVKEQGLNISIRSSILRTIQREPWLSKYYFEGDLASAILNRNIDRLEQALPFIDLEASFGTSSMPLSALDLAVGWPDGLRLLSTVWTDGISGTIELAVYQNEYNSVTVLREFSLPLFKDVAESMGYMRALLDHFGHLFLIDPLKRRRDSLAELARKYLSPGDQALLGLTDRKTLDARANTVYQLLKKRSVPVPASLNPGPAISVYSLAVNTYKRHSETFHYSRIVETLFALYAAGFCDIDERDDKTSYTPLESILNSNVSSDEIWVEISLWFLRVDASTTFHGPKTVNNILFGVAKSLASYAEKRYIENFDSGQMTKLVEYAAGLYSPVETDQCACFCSSTGCLPLHYLLRDPGWWTDCSCYDHRGYRVVSWMAACGITGGGDEEAEALYLEEATRLELFNRLGMIHTCCASGKSARSHAEIRRLQEDDDSELKSQLDLFMTSYRNSRRSWPVLEDGCVHITLLKCGCWNETDRWEKYIMGGLVAHWDWWWTKVNQILLDTLAFRRIRMVQGDREYAQIQASLLERLGYDGLEFTEVIRRHFAGYIDFDQSARDSKETEMDSAGREEESVSIEGGLAKQDADAGQNEGRIFVPRKRTELLEAALRFYEEGEFFQDEDYEGRDSEECAEEQTAEF